MHITLTASCDRGEYVSFAGDVPIEKAQCKTCAKGYYQSISARDWRRVVAHTTFTHPFCLCINCASLASTCFCY